MTMCGVPFADIQHALSLDGFSLVFRTHIVPGRGHTALSLWLFVRVRGLLGSADCREASFLTPCPLYTLKCGWAYVWQGAASCALA